MFEIKGADLQKGVRCVGHLLSAGMSTEERVVGFFPAKDQVVLISKGGITRVEVVLSAIIEAPVESLGVDFGLIQDIAKTISAGQPIRFVVAASGVTITSGSSVWRVPRVDPGPYGTGFSKLCPDSWDVIRAESLIESLEVVLPYMPLDSEELIIPELRVCCITPERILAGSNDRVVGVRWEATRKWSVDELVLSRWQVSAILSYLRLTGSPELRFCKSDNGWVMVFESVWVVFPFNQYVFPPQCVDLIQDVKPLIQVRAIDLLQALDRCWSLRSLKQDLAVGLFRAEQDTQLKVSTVDVIGAEAETTIDCKVLGDQAFDSHLDGKRLQSVLKELSNDVIRIYADDRSVHILTAEGRTHGVILNLEV